MRDQRPFPRSPDPLSRPEGLDSRPHQGRTRQGQCRVRSEGRADCRAGEHSWRGPSSNPWNLRLLPSVVHLLPTGWLARCPFPKVTL